jgi:AcrR family transcriptional regulator
MTPMSEAPDWKARPEGAEYDAVRRRLVDAAEDIVRQKGAGALRLDSVADAAGLHRSSIYRYFDSKGDLVTAVVVQATLRVGWKVIDALGEDAPPEQMLAEGLAMAMAELARDPVHRSLMEPSSSEAMARVGGKALREGIRPLVEPMFHAAAEQGVLRDGVTPDDALWWLQVVARGLMSAPADSIPEFHELAELLRLMLLPALLKDPRP